MTRVETPQQIVRSPSEYAKMAEQAESLNAPLSEALIGKQCVQAWLGYANVLFIGFGDHVLPPVAKGEKHALPPYEITTNHADWIIEILPEGPDYKKIATSEDERDMALPPVESLVGRYVEGFFYNTSSFELTIEFGDRLELQIRPWREAEFFGKEAWNLRDPNGVYFVAPCVDQATVDAVHYQNK